MQDCPRLYKSKRLTNDFLFQFKVKENTVGVTQFLTRQFAAELELRNHNENTRESTGFEHSALFIGPVVSYSHENWWLAVTWMRQLPALKTSLDNPQDKLILDEHEKNNIRMIASIHF